MPLFYDHEIIYQSSAPAALMEELVAVVDSTPLSESPGPVLWPEFHESRSEPMVEDVPPIGSGWFDDAPPVVFRPGYFEGRSEPMVEDVPEIGSGWFDDAPPIVFPRPRHFPSLTEPDLFDEVVADDVFSQTEIPILRPGYFESLSAITEEDVPEIGSGWFTNPPDVVERVPLHLSSSEVDLTDVPPIGSGWFANPPPVVLRERFHESRSEPMVEEVPDIGSGWFTNPPPVILRPFVALPGDPPGDMAEAVAIEDVFSEGPYLLLRRPFFDGASEPQLADVPPIGSGWFTNPPPVVLRPGYFVSVAEPTVEDVPDIGSGWFTDAPPVILRPGYFPSVTDSPFDIPGAPLVVKGPLSAILVHTGQSMAIEVTSGILKVVEVPSTIAGFAFLVHQGNLVAEEVTDGTLKADEC